MVITTLCNKAGYSRQSRLQEEDTRENGRLYGGNSIHKQKLQRIGNPNRIRLLQNDPTGDSLFLNVTSELQQYGWPRPLIRISNGVAVKRCMPRLWRASKALTRQHSLITMAIQASFPSPQFVEAFPSSQLFPPWKSGKQCS